MALSVETFNRLMASGRNYASMAVGLVGGIGLMSAAQQKGVMDAITEIGNGLNMIVHGATSIWQIAIVAFPFLAVWFARLASNSATTPNQAAQVVASIKEANNNPAVNIPTEVKVSVVNAAAQLPEVEKVVAPSLAPIPSTDPAVVVH